MDDHLRPARAYVPVIDRYQINGERKMGTPVGQGMQRWASITVLTAAGGMGVALFASSVNAASTIPPDKQALIDAQPSGVPSDPDDTAATGHSPVKPAVSDAGSSTVISAIETAVATAQAEFNTAQLLSPDLATRTQQAQDNQNDVTTASALGVASFVSGAKAANTPAAQGSTPTAPTASGFRVKMVDVFDDSVVIDQSTTLATQMLSDAKSTDIPSMVQTSFTAAAWQGVQVTGDTATALLVGSYSNCFNGGAFTSTVCQTSPDQQWQLQLHRGTDGKWRLTSRVGVAVESDPIVNESGPAPSAEPSDYSGPPPSSPATTPPTSAPVVTMTHRESPNEVSRCMP
jgi:hypothetical protein